MCLMAGQITELGVGVRGTHSLGYACVWLFVCEQRRNSLGYWIVYRTEGWLQYNDFTQLQESKIKKWDFTIEAATIILMG